MLEEYEGVITLTADFANDTLSGCIGCVGELVIRRAHFGIFLGDEVRDVQAVAADYELHLGVTPFNPDGTFEHTDVEFRHSDRTITNSEGFWGGALSNIPDRDGNTRLVAGFSDAAFEESDGSAGEFYGTFVGLSESFRASGRWVRLYVRCPIVGNDCFPPPMAGSSWSCGRQAEGQCDAAYSGAGRRGEGGEETTNDDACDGRGSFGGRPPGLVSAGHGAL